VKRRRPARGALELAIAVGLVVTGCAAHDDERGSRRVADEATAYAVQRLALDTLFNGREHAARLVIWATDAGDGPALESLGPALVRPSVGRSVDLARLRPTLPARVVTEQELAALFRRHPDAWAAFFRENPGAAGLVELAPVLLLERGLVAETYVGRTCGEHCRNVWRLDARRVGNHGWRVSAVHWVRVPGA
jgi:hypothetical protein